MILSERTTRDCTRTIWVSSRAVISPPLMSPVCKPLSCLWASLPPAGRGGRTRRSTHIHLGCSCHCRRNFAAKPAFHGVKSAVSVARGKYRSWAGSLQMSEKLTRADHSGPSPALIANPIKRSEKANLTPPHTLDYHCLFGCHVRMQHQHRKRKGAGVWGVAGHGAPEILCTLVRASIK